MRLGKEIKEIEKLWYELSLPLRQDIAYIYTEIEEARIEEIGRKLESLWKNKEFRLFLKKLHKESELKGLREIFTKRILFKTSPLKWQQEAKLRLGAFLALLSQGSKAFETFQKNLHESHSMPNDPFYRVGQIPQSKLVNGEHVKIAIIGAGFAGLAAAYFLLNLDYRGRDIVIIEKRKVGSGASGRAAGFCTASTEHDFIDMIELYGEEKA